jgi:hypothetical protein
MYINIILLLINYFSNLVRKDSSIYVRPSFATSIVVDFSKLSGQLPVSVSNTKLYNSNLLHSHMIVCICDLTSRDRIRRRSRRIIIIY